MAKTLTATLPFAILAIVMIISMVGQSPSTVSNRLDYLNVSFDVDPDGKSIVFSSASGELCVYDRTTHQIESLVCGKGFCSYPTYLAESNEILCSVAPNIGNAYSIFYFSLTDKRLEQLTKDENSSDILPTSNGGDKVYFGRSSRSRKYAFGGKIWVDWGIFVLDLKNGQTTQLCANEFQRLSSIAFDSTTQKLYFTAEMRSEDQVMNYDVPPVVLYSLSPENRVVLKSSATEVKNNAYCTDVKISSNGSRVYITDRYDDFHYIIEHLDSNTNEKKWIPASEVSKYLAAPTFDPNSTDILFLAATKWSNTNQPIFSLWKAENFEQEPTKLIAEANLLSCCDE